MSPFGYRARAVRRKEKCEWAAFGRRRAYASLHLCRDFSRQKPSRPPRRRGPTNNQEGDIMSWRAEYSSEKIVLYEDDRFYVEYELLPESHCQKCAAPIPPILKKFWKTTTCGNCSSLTGFTRVYAMGCYYVGPPYPQLTRHILDLKKNREIAKPLSNALASVIENRNPELLSIDALVPVPAHDRKLNERGYNQADILAIQLSPLIKKPILDCLRQIKYYSQREANREERFENVRGAFETSEDLQRKIRGRHLLLIDDVFTSGATLQECSNVLLSRGANEVNVLVLGRTCSR